MSPTRSSAHKLTPFAEVEGTAISYPPPQVDFLT